MRLPHLANDAAVEVAESARYVDANTWAGLGRVRSDCHGGIGYQFQLQLEGSVR